MPRILPTELLAIAEVARSTDLAVLVDLDGTLIPFARTPSEARLDDVACESLRALDRTGACVVVVSGRSRDSIEPLLPLVPNAIWVAEHGACRYVDGAWQGPSGPASELASLAASWSPLAAGTPGAWIEAKSLSLCFHWREVPERDGPELAARVELLAEEWLESEPEYERLPAVLALEVRRRGVHKGTAVTWLRSRRPGARILAIGDDVTDEDMFAALAPGDLAVLATHAPGRASRAGVWIDGPDEVRKLLGWLVRARTGECALPRGLLKTRRGLVRPRSPGDRLLVLSNRTPLPSSDERVREVGGLVSALGPALRERDGIWLGWSGREREGDPAVVLDEEEVPARASFDYPAVWRRRFYAGLCNRGLWPLLHGLIDRARYEDGDWAAYVEANLAYARFARELVDADATIWVHDYHLLLVAQALRSAGHVGPVGLFVHVPFPGDDTFETFPWAGQLIEAMRAFDLIGFHCDRWRDNFRRSAERYGPWTGAAESFPLGVDPQAFAPGAIPCSPDIAALCADLGERRLLLGVDRLDYSKGIPERLRAYERLLERFPEWRQKVVFVQVSVPSRADVPEYAELRRVVENQVGHINGRFGEATWVPVRYLFRSYDHAVLADLYRAASVAVVTPLRDGMNLVAKEFVAAQAEADPGVLVLSRFAGAAFELKDAILTNPYHIDGLAADLDRALRMPLDERRARLGRLRAGLDRSAPTTWAARFLARLDELTGSRGRAKRIEQLG